MIVPQIAVLFGTLLLRPYRLAHKVVVTVTLSDKELAMELYEDRRRPLRQRIPWNEVRSVEEAADIVYLHLLSKREVRLHKSLVANDLELIRRRIKALEYSAT